jgi:methionyl-tRNA formyltransferase
MTKPSVVFLGSGPVAADSLAIITDHFDIEAVITKPRPTHHREAAPVEVLAQSLGLPLYFAGTRKELDALTSDLSFTSKVGIVVDYGVIISADTIGRFPLGIINSHFSLLPEWRGADPITFSILSGQPKTGVSLMVIDEGLDTGKLITQKVLPIEPDDTTLTLTEKLVALSGDLLAEYLPRYIAGDITPKSQPHPDRTTHSRKLTKADGILDFTKPAEVLEREIRAFTGWPKSRTQLGGIDVIITKAHVSPAPTNPIGEIIAAPGTVLATKHSLEIVTANGNLVIDMLQPAGKKEMPVQAFLLGYGNKL